MGRCAAVSHLPQSPRRFHSGGAGAKGGEAEASLACRAEPGAGGADDARAVEQAVEKFP